jgi:hypothetical protein
MRSFGPVEFGGPVRGVWSSGLSDCPVATDCTAMICLRPGSLDARRRLRPCPEAGSQPLVRTGTEGPASVVQARSPRDALYYSSIVPLVLVLRHSGSPMGVLALPRPVALDGPPLATIQPRAHRGKKTIPKPRHGVGSVRMRPDITAAQRKSCVASGAWVVYGLGIYMMRIASVSLVLALALLRAASAADTMKTEEELKREAANSNSVETPRPQLSANPGAVPEVPMARETNQPAAPPAAPVVVATPDATQSRNVWAIILAVLVLLVGKFALKRLRSRSGPS